MSQSKNGLKDTRPNFIQSAVYESTGATELPGDGTFETTLKKKRILYLVSGSIAAFKSAQVVSDLAKLNISVDVVASPASLNFVGASTWEGLTGHAPHTDLFEPGQIMNHIHLAKEADLAVLCPATAQTLNKMAAGLGDDLIGALALAWNFSKPFLIFPAMNSRMLSHPATQNSLLTLSSWGYRVFGTQVGRLACGDFGEGKVLDPKLILEEILHHLHREEISPHVLVTGGGTNEAIDGVRTLSNFSTGSTAAGLCETLYRSGFQVTALLSSTVQKWPHQNITLEKFGDSQSLEKGLQRLLTEQKFDVVVHAAAVSDFNVKAIRLNGHLLRPDAHSKISSQDQLSLELEPNKKLLPLLKNYGPHKPMVIGFKLTSGGDESFVNEKVQSVFKAGGVNFVIQNDLSDIDPQRNRHGYQIFDRNRLVSRGNTKDNLFSDIRDLVISHLGSRLGKSARVEASDQATPSKNNLNEPFPNPSKEGEL